MHLSAQGARGARRWACVGLAGGPLQAVGLAGAGRRALGARACWASGRRRGRQTWGRGARGGRCLGMPVRMVGMLAGSAGPVWVLVNLAQF